MIRSLVGLVSLCFMLVSIPAMAIGPFAVDDTDQAGACNGTTCNFTATGTFDVGDISHTQGAQCGCLDQELADRIVVNTTNSTVWMTSLRNPNTSTCSDTVNFRAGANASSSRDPLIVVRKNSLSGAVSPDLGIGADDTGIPFNPGFLNVSSGFGVWGIGGTAVDSSGRLYVAFEDTAFNGDLDIRRFLSDGTLDTTWGTSGVVKIAEHPDGDGKFFLLEEDDDGYGGMFITPTGKMYIYGIVADGGASGGIWIARLTNGGTFDSTFNNSGFLQISDGQIGTNGLSGIAGEFITELPGSTTDLSSTAGTLDGSKLLIGGVIATNLTDGRAHLVLIRTVASTTTCSGLAYLDSAFDTDGIAVYSSSTAMTNPLQMGSIDVLGTKIAATATENLNDNSSMDLWAWKINESNGSVDTGFGSGTGRVELSTVVSSESSTDQTFIARAVVLDSTGSMWIGGGARWNMNGGTGSGGHDGFIVRLTSAGALDTNFNGSGKMAASDIKSIARAPASPPNLPAITSPIIYTFGTKAKLTSRMGCP